MELIEIGYFSRTKGLKGELVLKSTKEIDQGKLEAVFTERSGSMAPHFISAMHFSGNEYVLSLEGCSTVENARELLGRKVFAKQAVVCEKEEDDFVGYELLDRNKGSLGKIEGVSTVNKQMLVTIFIKGKEVILPLAADLITKMDNKRKQIHYCAPEGLIELYLGEEEGD